MVGLAVAAAFGVLVVNAGFSTYASPWIGDSPSYIEAARSLLRGEPLYNRFGWDQPKPLSLWPPGYPALVALLSLVGLPVLQAGMVLSAGSVVTVAPAAYWAVRPALSRLGACVAVLLSVSGPGVILYANTFGTEPLFLCLALLAIGCMVRGRFFAAGLFIGLSLLARNTGLALLPALGIAILTGRPGRISVSLSSWRAAVGLAGPVLALMSFNMLAHGTLRPYEMGQSTRPLALILQDMGRSLTFAVIPSATLSDAVPWILSLGGSVAVCCAALLTAVLRPGLPLRLRRALGALAAYALAGLAITVLGRVRYQWGAEITVRHASQYDWAILIVAAATVTVILTRWRRPAVIIAMGIAAAIVLLRSADVAARYDMLRKTDPLVAEAIATGLMPAHPLTRHIQLRQFFRHYEARRDLEVLARGAERNCRIVSTLFELLITQYDVPATQPPSGIPRDGSTLVIDALLPTDALAVPGNLPPGFNRVLADRFPPSIKVYTDNPERCLAPWRPSS